ncbi:MAG: AbrB/MazE/SpoVT family DNA-binding domain-containing protein [Actinobacteria bacterium]|nr:AbrB/MazE/SpoVT family DNA-binding domain-containing protein [Actinomycetota bacterium]
MASTNLRSKGQITIPADIRKAVHLEEGDPVEVELVADGILLRPQKVIDATQAWFWTAAWQQGERAAALEAAEGVGERHESGEELIAALRADVHGQ